MKHPAISALAHAIRVIVWGYMLWGPPALAQTLTYGPILGRGVTPDQMIIKWGTGGTTDPTSVSYRKQGAPSFQTQSFAASRDHEGVLTGLSQGTTYEYYVTSGAAKSDTFTFSTCPLPGMPMNVVFYGDSRSGPSEHAKIVAHLLTDMPEMVFESGDITLTGTYATYLSEFVPVTKDLVESTPFMAAPGNHDALSDLATNYGLIFPSPRQKPGDPWQPYYAFTCGNSMFIALNSNSVADATQQGFLLGRLNAAAADPTVEHVFVWFHHGVYSPGEHGDTVSIQQAWVPLFDDPYHKVTAVFNGHDHIYARMNNGSKVVYTISGGAGADLYTVTGTSAASKVFAASTYNYVALNISGPQVSATAFDDTGTKIDSWSMVQNNPNGNDPNDFAQGAADMSATTDKPDGATAGPPASGCSLVRGGGSGGGSRPAGGAALSLLGAVALGLRRRRVVR